MPADLLKRMLRGAFMSHVVLLGDSIFDNDRYVPGGPSVIAHLRKLLPASWRATLLARDGTGTAEVSRQLELLPDDATHLVVSVGGNDALDHSSLLLHEPAGSFAEVLSRLAEIQEQFRRDYRDLLQRLLDAGRPMAVCTVYDSIPGLDPVEKAGLCLFNDVILRGAFATGLPAIDLRLVCTDADDYSRASRIEPSVVGGRKIARAVARLVTDCDFKGEGSRVFV
jgi:GDSL-like Lipase/Acylhydrolase family